MATAATIESILESESASAELQILGVANTRRARTNFLNMAQCGLPLDLLQSLFDQLTAHLPTTSDPDMALNNLERFVTGSRNVLSIGTLLERDRSAIPILLKIFSNSQYLTDQLIRDSESYDSLRLTEGQPLARQNLIDELSASLASVSADDADRAMSVIRRFKHLETLRVAFGDLIAKQDLQTVIHQISYLADTICQATLEFCLRKASTRYGQPISGDGQLSQLCAIAMGKLGGNELNYSSDIDLVFFYDHDGMTNGARSIVNRDFFNRVIRDFVKLLTESTSLGTVYRVDLRLRPGGSKAALCCSTSAALSYYDYQGRTWERQALVKARVVAGNENVGQRLLGDLQPWIYAKRLSLAEIQGIKALKRQIERRTLIEGEDERNLKTGRGGIRDIEFVIQFLQLLHGSESISLRTGNTLETISRLFESGCITSQEQLLLDHGYRWLRRLEHRLQIMFDLQTHSLPENESELRKIALRMGYREQADREKAVLQQFKTDFQTIKRHNRRILNHLLHDAFPDDSSREVGAANDIPHEIDLVLDADPDADWVDAVMREHGFRETTAAFRNLLDLATEKNRFLSPRRCRHFLAAITPRLLDEIANTPNPDETLRTLSSVSQSLGGKAVLWELLQTNQPMMELYVRLCASCRYLCDLLRGNPGMIDNLIDSLVMKQLPNQEFLSRSLNDLLAGAEDVDPIIHSFKHASHLRVGARDISGQDAIQDTHRALADIAEVCLGAVTDFEYEQLAARFGTPLTTSGRPCPLIVLAMGKLAGREPNYHSDLDVVFLYDSLGSQPTDGGRDQTSNQDFFSRLCANITKRISHAGPYGRLYEIDNRLRPTGKSGSLAVALNEFIRYFSSGEGQLWERLALCKARPLFCDPETDAHIRGVVREMITSHPWSPAQAREIQNMRFRMQDTAQPQNIKRGVGGTVDIEFAVQMLQLKHAPLFPDVLVPGTLAAAGALHAHRLISTDDFEFMGRSYAMLRWVEARLRLMNTAARHDLPDEPEELAKLAYLLEYDDPQELLAEIESLRRENRRRFLKLIELNSAG